MVEVDKMNNKGQYTVGALGSLAIVLVVAAIIIAVGAEIIADVGTEIADDSGYVCGTSGDVAFNVTCEGLDGVAVFGEWLDTIALIIVAAVVIGIIATSFGRR